MTYSATTDESLVNINSYMSDVLGTLGTTTEDWTPALQHANDDIVTSGQHKTIFIPQDIVIQNTFNWDVKYVSLKGNGSTIRAIINDSTKYAILTRSIAPSSGGGTGGGDGGSGGTTTEAFPNPPISFTQATTMFEGLKLVGSQTPTCRGLGLDGEPNSAGASHIAIQNATITGFVHGEELLHSAYMIGHYNVDICDNTFAIVLDDQYDTYVSGERIVYTNCNFYNNQTAIYLDNQDAEFYFMNCSIDFASNQIITLHNGRIFMEGCHTENYIDDYSGDRSPFYIGAGNGNYLSMKDGSIQFHYPATTSQVSYIFTNNAVGRGGLLVENCSILGAQSATGFLVGGSGNSIFKDIVGNVNNNSSLKIQDTNNLLMDGDFEQGSIIDDIYVFTDTGVLAPYTQQGTNLQLSVSNDCARTGLQSLKALKQGASGTEASFIITVPIHENRIPFAEFYHKVLDPSLTGSIEVNTGFFRKNEDGERQHYEQSTTQTLGLSWDWSWVYALPTKIPKWATHYYITVSFTNFNGNGAAGIYFDNLYVGEM